MQLPLDPDSIKGFLHPEEGARLYDLALGAAQIGPCLEVGSYCGKSTLYLGAACQERGQVLYAVDHHRGSEEHQAGEEYHDPELFDAEACKLDSFREFRATLARAGLEDCVIPVVTSSELAGRHWLTPLGLVFIDGGHSLEAAFTDYRTWAPHVMPGGYLAIHDIFENPADGGQAPFEIYKRGSASGLFEVLVSTRTLGVMRRLG
ncbi:MAG: class I SAM-dependent methyltransferase [Gammaproteobacteria bacterium]|nr:class I SAM-dependent methyltransferase [Gammaproteobacteria bacterium]